MFYIMIEVEVTWSCIEKFGRSFPKADVLGHVDAFKQKALLL